MRLGHCAVLALAALCILLLPGQAAQADDWEREASQSARENAEHESGHHHSARESSVDTRSARERFAFNLPYAGKDEYLSFDDLCDSGDPFVLVWWLSDCPVCHLQLPYVQKLQAMVEEGKADLRVVSINIDYGTEDCLEFCEERSISFEVLHDARCRRTDAGFRIDDMGTPSTYVFKPGGELVDRISGWTSGYPEKVLKALGLEPNEPAAADSSTEAQPSA
jgi:thiol-disulfide isomerase/thioredoxin